MDEFRVLGELELVRDGAVLALPSRRQRALLARLLLSRGRVVPAGELVAALWDTEPPPGARHALHTYVSRVRGLLGPAVVTRPPGYLLAVPPEAVDAERFEVEVAAAARLAGDAPAAAVARFDQALARWRGPAYAEFTGTFAQAAAVRLEELRLTAREGRAEALLGSGAVDRVLGELRELATDHPLRERSHGQLMRALSAAGRQAEALAVFDRFRRRVADELGLDPSPALREVHAQVLRHEVARPAGMPPAAAAVPVAGVPAPAPMSSFVGRDGELRRLSELVGQCRIVTVVGPGGVGKSRLARELAARVPVAWWVDLVPAADPAELPYRFAAALGLPEPAEVPMADFLLEPLRTARGLLVVDTCEHLVGPVAQLAERIAGTCPEVVVLATSRERLATDGEQVLPLAPLPDPDAASGPELRRAPAVALFADRLRAAGAPEPPVADLPAVAEICRRVGGLPLAIELAAARAGSLGVATVAARPGLDLLAGGRRTGQPRHRSLRAVLDWSHSLLEPPEQLLFRRLAVFRGPVRLDDVEQVCVDGLLAQPEVAVALAGLVDKSMVAGPEQGRYRLLDPMRVYASEQLAGHGEDRWLAAAHARHLTGYAERARAGLLTAAEPEWAGGIAERLDELRAAHRWAVANDADRAVRLPVALAGYAAYYLRFELQDWAAVAAALPAATGHPLRPAALASAASGAWARGDFVAAERLARRGLALAGDQASAAARAVLVLGDVAMLEGRFADAAREYQKLVRVAGDAEPGIACEAYGSWAMARCHQGEPDQAGELVAACQRRADELGAPGLMAMSRYFAGECRLVTDPAGALPLLAEARRLAAGTGARFVIGLATLSSVSIRARAGADPAAALRAYREAVEHWRQVGNRTQQWVTLRNLVPVLVAAGEDSLAELALVLHGALAAAPVRLPAGAPEAEALAAAVARARERLGPAAPAASERGAAADLEELLRQVLAATAPVPDQAGSSR